MLAAYLIEAGLILVFAPWSQWWVDKNYFAHAVPWLGWWMSNSFVRGGVTGVGIVTAFAGVRDLSGVIVARSTASDAQPPAS